MITLSIYFERILNGVFLCFLCLLRRSFNLRIQSTYAIIMQRTFMSNPLENMRRRRKNKQVVCAKRICCCVVFCDAIYLLSLVSFQVLSLSFCFYLDNANKQYVFCDFIFNQTNLFGEIFVAYFFQKKKIFFVYLPSRRLSLRFFQKK